jgi:hypothetical protein
MTNDRGTLTGVTAHPPPSLGLLAEVTRLFDINMTEYRGCFLREAAFSADNVDQWLQSTSGDIAAVENVVNHVHLYDEVDDTYEDAQLSELEDVGRRLARVWRELLSHRYPGRSFTVTYETEPDEYGPTISVHQADGSAAMR